MRHERYVQIRAELYLDIGWVSAGGGSGEELYDPEVYLRDSEMGESKANRQNLFFNRFTPFSCLSVVHLELILP